MKVVREARKMQDLSRSLIGQGKTIGFVPTMGYLHDGHVSLMEKARRENDVVVLSVFVNPLQFGPKEDFAAYPRDFKRDEALAKKAGVDVILYPDAKEIYPEGYATYVDVDKMTEGLCGAFRPGHFKGVTTVVAKLFGIVKPDAAYFGQKDAQQAVVIKRMVEDLNMGIRIEVCPTIRDPDGLAMSSRNTYLSKEERRDAAVLYKSLRKARDLIRRGERDPRKVMEAMREMINARRKAKIQYIAIVDTKELKPVKRISGETLIALAVFVGKTRLIDNIIVRA